MLSVPVRLQSFQSIAGRNTEIAEYPGLIQETKLPQRNVLDVGRESSAALAGPDQLCLGVREALNDGRL
jgi:hypothetical protein